MTRRLKARSVSRRITVGLQVMHWQYRLNRLTLTALARYCADTTTCDSRFSSSLFSNFYSNSILVLRKILGLVLVLVNDLVLIFAFVSIPLTKISLHVTHVNDVTHIALRQQPRVSNADMSRKLGTLIVIFFHLRFDHLTSD